MATAPGHDPSDRRDIVPWPADRPRPNVTIHMVYRWGDDGAFFGKVARVDLSDFLTVSVLDLTDTDSDLKGFWGGFTDGSYGYFVPYSNGAYYFGKVARIDVVSHTQGIGWTSSP